MSIQDFASQYQRATSKYGLFSGSRMAVEKALERTLIQVGQKVNYGTKPLEKDWDILIILDACRADLFEEFAPQHPLSEKFETTSSIYSCASTSSEWFKKAFGEATDADPENVHYISANPFSRCVDSSRFYEMTELWQFVDRGCHHCPPDAVTSETLRIYEESDANQFVIHYLPPHAPFLHCPDKYRIDDPVWKSSHDVWLGLQSGEFDKEDIWNDYGKNLLAALDEVEILVSHLSGKIAITADHANGIGEFGVYGHAPYSPVPAVKRVPWVTLSGMRNEYDANQFEKLSAGEIDSDSEEQLAALGYL